MKKIFLLLITFSVVFFTTPESYAQENTECDSPVTFNLGADLVSRYVWRGVEFGVNTPHFQPWASLDLDLKKSGTLSLGCWASYGFNTGFAENDIYLTYAVDTKAGSFGLSLTGYHYPNAGIKFTELDDEGNGAHTIEFAFSYALPMVPLSILISNNIYNDIPDDNSLYAELGYSFSVKDVDASIFIGGASGRSAWHGVATEKFELVNTGFTLSKSIGITDQFELPLSVSWVFNTHTKKTFLIMGVSL